MLDEILQALRGGNPDLPGRKFGPAVGRFSRDKIRFRPRTDTSAAGETNAQFNPSGINIFDFLFGGPTIEVSTREARTLAPRSNQDIQRSLAHEQLHSLFSKDRDGQLALANLQVENRGDAFSNQDFVIRGLLDADDNKQNKVLQKAREKTDNPTLLRVQKILKALGR